MNEVSKLFANEILELVDAKHKESLRRIDYQFRTLKENLKSWASGKDSFVYLIEQLSPDQKEKEENLERFMKELREE